MISRAADRQADGLFALSAVHRRAHLEVQQRERFCEGLQKTEVKARNYLDGGKEQEEEW